MDDEFGGGQEIGVGGILGAEEGLAALHEEALQRGLAVDERGDDVTRSRFARREKNDVAVEDAGTGHGVAAHAESEEAAVRTQAEGGGIDGEVTIRFLFAGGGQTGGDRAVERNVEQGGAAKFGGGREEGAGFAGDAVKHAFGFECLQVARSGERTGETEVRLDFTQRRVVAVLALVGLHEIKNRALFVGEGRGVAHSVQMNTRAGAMQATVANARSASSQVAPGAEDAPVFFAQAMSVAVERAGKNRSRSARGRSVTRGMRLIDSHVHLYPPVIASDPVAWAQAAGEAHWARLATRRRRDGAPVQLFPTVDELLRDLDAAEIERAVLLGWYWEHASSCALQNHFYAECIRAHPDRLSAFAAVPLAERAQAVEIVHWAQDNGFAGLGELSPHSVGGAAALALLPEVLAAAGAAKLPVNLHVSDPTARKFDGWIETPLTDFLAWARAFPDTTFVLAHWGGGLAFQESSRALTNVYFDTAASPLLGAATAWPRAVAAVGADRLLFGSDYPLRLYPRTNEGTGLTDFAREARTALSAVELAQVGRANAQRLLGTCQ